MNLSIKLNFFNNHKSVCWTVETKIIELEFQNKILGLITYSSQNVIIVELKDERLNGYLYSKNGNLIKELANPIVNSIGFGDLYYETNKIVLISVKRDASIFRVIVSEDGDIIHFTEAR